MKPLFRACALFFALLGVLASSLLLGSSASAIMATGQGVGYVAEGDGGAFIGSYRLADNSLAFCLQAGKGAPPGNDYSLVDGAPLGWFSAEDLARLAHISRRSASSTDQLTAASGQLATWMIAGLNGKTPEHYAARANRVAPSVLEKASALIGQANGIAGASRSVTSAVSIAPNASDNSLAVTAALTVDFLASGPTTISPGAHTGTLRLIGAHFADGSTEQAIGNSQAITIVPNSTNAVGTVTASVSFENLPYGNDIVVGTSNEHVQNLLIVRPASASAHASLGIDAPSTLPFQPVVSTITSAAESVVGAAISDELTLSVDPGEGRTSEWGVFRIPATADSPESFAPIPVTVESTLYGPFTDPIVPADSPPAQAPIACTVSVVVTTGPGIYRTPECTLAAAGYYVWTERIVPGTTPAEQGSAKILPWNSPFGTASEITFVAPVPAAAPAASNGEQPSPQLADTGVNHQQLEQLAGVALAIAVLGAAVSGLMRRRTREQLTTSRWAQS